MAVRALATVGLVVVLGALGKGWLLATPPVARSPAAAAGPPAQTPGPAQSTPRALGVRFSWDASTESDLAGYVVSWGDKPGAYTESKAVGRDVTSIQLEVAMRPQPYYVAVQARNAAGQVSGYSNEFSLDVSSGKAKALKPAKAEKAPKAKRDKPAKQKKPKKQKKQKTTP